MLYLPSHYWVRILILIVASLLLTTNSYAQNQPIGFEADNVVVNQEENSLFATGNVVLKQAGETLRADEVTYYRSENKAVARGNVVHTDAAGSVTNAVMMEVDTEFTHILAETLITRFAGGNWMAADSADRTAGESSIFDASRFTPCNCDFLNGERPLWDIRASQSVHNEKTKTITHYNTRMHVMNVPVTYLPFLSHPDWTVKRRSGFLTPSFQISSDLGVAPSVPYFHVINETSDVELTAHKYQYRGLALKSHYRKLWDKAELSSTFYTANVETYKKTRELVGAIDANYSSRIGNGWEVNGQLRRASQDTFLRRYDFNDDTSLKSMISAERINDNRYYLVEVSDQQSLLTADKLLNEQTVLPHVFYEKLAKGWRENQHFRTELSAIHLDNDEDHDLARWAGVFEVSEAFQLPIGITSYQANITGNYYTMQSKPNAATTKIGEVAFATPALSVGWQMPIVVSGLERSAIIEPQAKLVYVGGSDRTNDIPNRDASDYRIDEANLFLLNRYQGKDYVLPGSRVDLGLSAVTNDKWLGDVTAFAGISRRFSGNPSSGLNTAQIDKYSDYVGSLSINPANSLSLRWSGRLSSHDLGLNESKTSISSDIGTGNLSLTHNQLTKAYFADSNDDREELSATYNQPLPGGWHLSTTQLWNLSDSQNTRQKSSASLTWDGGVQDCLTVTINYQHEQIADRDIDSIDQLNIVVSFKNLGAVTQAAADAISQ